MAAGQTINFNANPETRKVLVGIAKNVKAKSTSRWFSSGSTVLSTETEIRNTLTVNVLIPFMIGAKKVEDVITEAMTTGGVKTSKPKLAERIVKLENRLITEPLMYYPRDTEVLGADVLLSRYQDGFTTTAIVIKDRAYFRTILAQGKAGLSTSGEKIEIVDTTAAHNAATRIERAEAFKELIDNATVRLMEYTDGVIQGNFENSDIAIGATPSLHKLLNSMKKQVIRTDAAYQAFAANSPVQIDGLYDGIHEFKSTKQLKQENIDFIVMIKGAAVSQFLFMEMMNFDKVAGLNAYKMSLQFDEGTGVYFPQLITMGAKTADHAAQNAVGSGTLDIMANVGTSTTTGTNPS